MNTGIGDAVNLAWKLTEVLHGRSNASLLDSYEPERIAFARRLVATTDRAFTGVTSSGVIARRLRMNIMPRLIPLLFKLSPFRRFVFRTISQTAVNYRGSSLSVGHAGSVYGGDRLPWVRLHVNNDAADNYRSLTSLDWQVHVYGDPAAELQPLCDSRKLSLYVFPWRSEMGRTGIKRNAIYLVRPDGYVALADQEGQATAISAYLDVRRITLTR